MNICIIISLFFLISCAAGMKEHPAKMDAPLRQKIAAMEKSRGAETILILGKCSRPVDEPIRQAIQQTGAQLGSVTGAIFTASATATQIRILTTMGFIEQLQLSVERYPQGP